MMDSYAIHTFRISGANTLHISVFHQTLFHTCRSGSNAISPLLKSCLAMELGIPRLQKQQNTVP